jgi:hypothetical protein
MGELPYRVPRPVHGGSGTATASAVTAWWSGFGRPSWRVRRSTRSSLKEALRLLGRMHLRGADQLAMRERVGELVRQLAWGPVDVSDAPVARPAP